jgi:spermidine/putrescine transport system substrate-binding protein
MQRILNSPYVTVVLLVVSVLAITGVFTNKPQPVRSFFLPVEHIEPEERIDTLHIYSPAGYFTDDFLDNFADLSNSNVVISIFDTTDEMVRHILAGRSFDIVVAQDYAMQKLAKAGKLMRIDSRRIPNYLNIDSRFRELDYDYMHDFAVPYFWGSVGITYNKNYSTGIPLSWDDLFNPAKIRHNRYRISLIDDRRTTMGIALIASGLDPNTTNEEEIRRAVMNLCGILPYLGGIYFHDIDQLFETEQMVIGMTWSADAAFASYTNKKIRFSLPSEGSIFFIDNLVIPENSSRKSLAHAFINYMLDPKIAASLTNDNFTANPVTHSRRFIRRIILKGPAYKNPFLSGSTYILEDIAEADAIYERFWYTFTDSARVIMAEKDEVRRNDDRFFVF